MSFLGGSINSQTLNGIESITDGYITIQDGTISNLQELSIGGDVTVGTNLYVGGKITCAYTATLDTDVPNKLYVDLGLSSLNTSQFLKLDGSTPMTGGLIMGGNYINGLPTAINPSDATNKSYVDAGDAAVVTQMQNADALRLLKSGDTMTGSLNMTGNTILNLATTTLATSAVNKAQMDTADAVVVTQMQTADNLRLLKAGDTMTGGLNMGGNIITNLPYPSSDTTDAVNKNYCDTEDNKRLRLDGSSAMTGQLNMNAQQINNCPNINAGATMNFKIGGTTVMNTLSTGLVLSQPINMNSKLINGLGNGVATTDAVNKSQMDTADLLKMDKANGVGTGTMILTHTNTQLKLVNTNTTQQTGNVVIQSILSGSVDFWDSNGLTSASIQSSSADRTMILSGAGVPSIILSSTLVKLLKQTQITGGLKMISGELDMNALNITNTNNIHSNGTNPIYLNNSGVAKVKIDSSGLTMQNSGNIDMSGNNLSNVNIISSPATTPLYISNSNVANCTFDSTGLVMASAKKINMNGSNINFLANSIATGDAVNRYEIVNSLIPLTAWRSGEIIQTILNGKSLGQVLFNSSIPKDITGSLAAGTNASIFYAMSFAPKSTSSIIYVTVDGSCTMSGTGSDQFKAYLGKYVGTTTTSYMLHNCYTTQQGGLRGVSVFPITACWSNTTLTSYTIGCYFDTNDMDDNIIFNDEFNIKIQEIKI